MKSSYQNDYNDKSNANNNFKQENKKPPTFDNKIENKNSMSSSMKNYILDNNKKNTTNLTNSTRPNLYGTYGSSQILSNKDYSNPSTKVNDMSKSVNLSARQETSKINENLRETKNSFDSKFSPAHQEYIWNKLVGLENLGNTCFMSTSIQCLTHSKSFMRFFLNEFEKENLPDMENINFQLYILITSLIEATNHDSISMEQFKDKFGDKFNKYGGYAQNDSQEFLRCLLEELNNELNYAKLKKFFPFSSNEKDIRKFNIDYHNHFKSYEDSIIVDFFYGQVFNCFTCNSCFTTINTCEKFMDIPLSLPSENYISFDLMKLLEESYLKKEQVELAACGNKNKKCKSKMYTKESRLTMLPEILIISFQRYNLRNKTKNNSKIKFYEEIDLANLVDKKNIVAKTNTKYKLYAISNHKGDLDFGHCWANCKINKKWYEFNDSKVVEIQNLDFNNEIVYALFYEKVELNN